MLRFIALILYMGLLLSLMVWMIECTRLPFADSRYGSGLVCQWRDG